MLGKKKFFSYCILLKTNPRVEYFAVITVNISEIHGMRENFHDMLLNKKEKVNKFSLLKF